MVRLCSNLFNSVLCHGIEEAIMILDDKARVLLPETYMAYPPRSFDIAIVPRHPTLVIRDIHEFSRAWPKMEASINFLLRWRGVRDDQDCEWLLNYLNIFNSYIEPGTDLNDWVNLEFCLPNFEKSSKERTSLVFPPNFHFEDSHEISKVIMVSKKLE